MKKDQIFKNKIKIVSKKLIALGYNRFNKRRVGLGDDSGIEAKEFQRQLPDISFCNENYEINFHFNDGLIKVLNITKCKDEFFEGEYVAQLIETEPFNKIKIDDFYRLFVEKNHDVSIILNSGNN